MNNINKNNCISLIGEYQIKTEEFFRSFLKVCEQSIGEIFYMDFQFIINSILIKVLHLN
jgi:hypothetical protein